MPWIFENIIMAPCSPDFPTAKLFDSIAAFMGDNIGGDVSIDIVSIELASSVVYALFIVVLGGIDSRLPDNNIFALGLCCSGFVSS